MRLATTRSWASVVAPSVSVILLCFATVALTAAPPGKIPDALLDGIRGSNPNTALSAGLSCQQININSENSFDPPQGPSTAVAWNMCQFGMNGNTECIFCPLNPEQSVTPIDGAGNANIAGGSAIDCGTGTAGTCGLVGNMPLCLKQTAFTCAITATQYPQQAVGAQPQP
jgi:hypothetical protein